MTTASESGAFLACIPVVALIMSSLILKEWPSVGRYRCHHHLVGIIIAVLLLAVHPLLPCGLLDSRSGSRLYALYCVDVERASQFSSLEITYFMLASGCLTLDSLHSAKAF
ncbi:MAG: hypothetical protein ACLS5G_00795 [Streptococcus sp.]